MSSLTANGGAEVPGAIGTNRIGGLLAKAGILWAFLGLFIILSILSPAFITPNNLMNVIKQMSVNGIMGIAMTFVLILGGIDLSVGSLIALTSVCAAFLLGNLSICH